MSKIDILIERLGARLNELAISERAASIEATGSPDAIRYIRARRAMPSAERLSRLAETLSATPEYLLGDTDENHYIALQEPGDWDLARKAQGMEALAAKSQATPTFRSGTWSDRDGIPVFVSKTAERKMFQYSQVDQAGRVYLAEDGARKMAVQCIAVDFTRTIRRLSLSFVERDEIEHTYSIFLPVNCLFPAVPIGEPLLASTVLPISEHDLGLFYVRDDSGKEDAPIYAIPAFVRRLAADFYDLEQFVGTGDFDFGGVQFRVPADQVHRMDRIYTMPDLLR